MAQFKFCYQCKTEKSLDEFYNNRSKPDGRSSECKICQKAREKLRAIKDKDKLKAYQIFYKFGVTKTQYEEMKEKQKGLCAICGLSPEEVHSKNKHLCVDHNHTTGKVRALLCSKCNFAVGHMNDNPQLLIKAAEYLVSHEEE